MTVRLLLAIAVWSAPLLRADEIASGLRRLYNFDFAGAHKHMDAFIAAHPDDPTGYAFRASVYLFYELDRLRILQSDFFADDKKISGKEKLQPDEQIRSRFFAAVDKSQALADQRIARNPYDQKALFAYCLTEGMRTDYTAFVEKKQLRSLSSARKSHNYAVALLKQNPDFVDAYLTTGLTEYMVGSLPFFIRWFVKFEHTKGSKEQAVINLEKVASHGKYLGPFARILLSVIHLREKRLPKTVELLEGLTREYPENPLLRAEYEKARKKVAGKAATGG